MGVDAGRLPMGVGEDVAVRYAVERVVASEMAMIKDCTPR